MIVDASSECAQATFNIGALTTTSRKWNIRVTQYACGDWDMSGWPGCLQYYTSTASTIQNFGYPSSATTVTSTITHLSNQNYDICIRRASGYCLICYTQAVTGTAASKSAQISFGLSVGGIAATASAETHTSCTADYIAIPFGMSAANAAITTTIALVPGTTQANSYCGRIFNFNEDETSGVTVCTRRAPFTVGVHFDSNELTDDAVVNGMATTQESSEGPGGIIGFKLIYYQVAC